MEMAVVAWLRFCAVHENVAPLCEESVGPCGSDRPARTARAGHIMPPLFGTLSDYRMSHVLGQARFFYLPDESTDRRRPATGSPTNGDT